MELNKSNMKKLMLIIAFGIALYLGLQNIYRFSELANSLAMIAEPLLLGMAFAFILNVFMRQVEKHLFAPLNRKYTKLWPRFRRPLALIITLLIFIGAGVLISFLLVPQLVNTIQNIANNVPAAFENLQVSINSFADKHPFIHRYLGKIQIDWSNISQMLTQYGQKLANGLVSSTISAASSIFHGMITFILAVVFAINILLQKERLSRQMKRILFAYLPQKRALGTVRICRLTNRAFTNFVAGQCTEACILGILCTIGMRIFHFPYALLISVLVAFMSLIPIFGTFLSAIIGALLILFINPIQAVWFVVFFVILQQLEGNLIYPRVVGHKVGLPALWVLAAVTIGGNAFGLIGMLINIPICSVLYTLLREDVKKRLENRGQKKKEKSDLLSGDKPE